MNIIKPIWEKNIFVISVKKTGFDFKLITIKNGYHILKCPFCGVYFVDPQSSERDLKKIYSFDKGYFKHADFNKNIAFHYPGAGFSKQGNGVDFAREEANHHSMKVLAGDVPREKIREFMRFADKYNADSKAVKALYKSQVW